MRQQVGQDVGKQGDGIRKRTKGENDDARSGKWSWIGVRSPLMDEKEEAEWLLERFFERLEESLGAEARTKEMEKGQDYATHLPESRQQEDDSSEGTVSGRQRRSR